MKELIIELCSDETEAEAAEAEYQGSHKLADVPSEVFDKVLVLDRGNTPGDLVGRYRSYRVRVFAR